WATPRTAVFDVARICRTPAMRPHPTIRRTPIAINALLRRGFVGDSRVPAGGAGCPLAEPARMRGGAVVVTMTPSVGYFEGFPDNSSALGAHRHLSAWAHPV